MKMIKYVVGIITIALVLFSCSTIDQSVFDEESNIIKTDRYHLSIEGVNYGGKSFIDGEEKFKVTDRTKQIISLKYTVYNNTNEIINLPSFSDLEIISVCSNEDYQLNRFSRVIGVFSLDYKYTIEANTSVTNEIIYVIPQKNKVVGIFHKRDKVIDFLKNDKKLLDYCDLEREKANVFNDLSMLNWNDINEKMKKLNMTWDDENSEGNTFLLEAAFHNNIGVIEGLCDKYDISLLDYKIPKMIFLNTDYFHKAAEKANIDTMKYLLTKGFDINQLDDSRSHVLEYAVNGNNVKTLIGLIELGADVNQAKINNGMGSIKLSTYAKNLGLENLSLMIQSLEKGKN